MLLPKGLLYAYRSYPEKIAAIDMNAKLTYAELTNRTAKLKSFLKELNIQKGDRVGIFLFNDFRYLEILYGATAIGSIVCPMNIRLSVEETAAILNDAEVKMLFIHQEFIDMVEPLKQLVPSLNHVILTETNETYNKLGNTDVLCYEDCLLGQADQPFTIDEIDENDIAGLFYTGGTTGRSKGVMLTHRNLVMNAFHVATSVQYHADEVYLHAAPMFHLADGASTFAVTVVGGTHAHVRFFTPTGVLEAVEKMNVSAMLLVPTMINMVLNHPEFDQYNTTSLRKILYGASPISVELLKLAMKKWPQVRFNQAFGMTEASPVLTFLLHDDHLKGLSGEKAGVLASCGKPVQYVEMKVVDPEGKELPPYQVGEIAAKSPTIMKGYWNMPEETAAVLKNGWYHTGDLAYRDEDNYFYVVDRAKDMIITGGENVYSTEVENIIYQIDGVLECSIVGVPDSKWGEAVKAVIVLKEGVTLTEEDILSYARSKLANFKVPKSVDFVHELPKSGAGKILKRTLRDQYWKQEGRSIH